MRRFPFEERDPGLSLLPLTVRRKLDLAGRKLSLEGWHALSFAERVALAEAPGVTAAEVAAFRTMLDAFAARAGIAVPSLVVPALPRWREAAPPEEVAARVREAGGALDAVRWASLDDDARFALVSRAAKRDAAELARVVAALGLAEPEAAVRVRAAATARRGKTVDGAVRADEVAVEEPLEIRVDGETVAVTMRTPGDDEKLAAGFLFAEGIVRDRDDVGEMIRCAPLDDETRGNVLDVRSAAGRVLDVERVLASRRWAVTSSACGVCGRASVQDLVARVGHADPAVQVPRALVVAAVAALRAVQPVFARTGGVHAAAIYDRMGRRLASFEDVGRHNAVDKAIGALLLEGRVGRGATGADGAPVLLVVSGRAGFEIVQKAAAARIPVVASVSAASSLAIDVARAAGVTLAAFARDGHLSVYSAPERLTSPRAQHDEELRTDSV